MVNTIIWQGWWEGARPGDEETDKGNVSRGSLKEGKEKGRRKWALKNSRLEKEAGKKNRQRRSRDMTKRIIFQEEVHRKGRGKGDGRKGKR